MPPLSFQAAISRPCLGIALGLGLALCLTPPTGNLAHADDAPTAVATPTAPTAVEPAPAAPPGEPVIVHTWYDEAHTKVETEYRTIDGVVDGEIRFFSRSGALIATRNVVRGVRQGPERWYRPDGTLGTEVTWRDDKRNGPSLDFYPNGKVQIQESYVDDLRDGESRSYNEDGYLVTTCTFAKGVLQGPLRHYFDDGTLMDEVTLADGKREGVEKTFTRTGKVVRERTFAADIQVGPPRYWGLDGARLPDGPAPDPAAATTGDATRAATANAIDGGGAAPTPDVGGTNLLHRTH